MSLRVLHCLPRLGAGGAERVFLTLIQDQQRAGFTTEICFVSGGGSSTDQRWSAVPTPVVLNGPLSNRDVLGFRRTCFRLRSLIQDRQIDVVHSHLWPAARFCESALRGSSVPHVIQVQDTLPWLTSPDFRSRLHRWMMRRTLSRRPGRIRYLAVSAATRDTTQRALKLNAADFRVVHNALDDQLGAQLLRNEPRWQESTDSSTVTIRIGVAGRLAVEKGFDLMIRALARIRSAGLNAVLWIAGTGGQEENLRQLCSEMGLEIGRDVEFPGAVSDMVSFYRSLDVFVLPSVSSEGLSLAQLEAMASGLPVVVTKVAGAEEAVQDQKNGLLIPPRDINAIEASVKSLIMNRQLRRSLGEAARETVRTRFLEAPMCNAVRETYQSLIASR